MNATLSRRSFLHTTALASGGLLLSFGWQAPALAQPAASASLRPNGYVRLDPNGQITVWSKNPDMGQGVKTAFAMILAEEMDADWSRVQVLDAELNRALFGGQGSGGSGSMRDEWDLYRNAGAAIREMLADTAAEAWRVPRAECRTERGRVLHAATNRAQNFGDLATAASTRTAPAKPAWKPTSAFTLLGTRVPGVDNPQIVTGRPLYGIDVRLPNMKFAAIAKCPVFGGRVARVDDAAALKVPGVRQVVRIAGHDNPTFLMPGVAVVADSTWAAFKGRDALQVQWDEGPYKDESTTTLSAQFAELARAQGTTVRAVGDVEQALAGAARVVEAYLRVPLPVARHARTAQLHRRRARRPLLHHWSAPDAGVGRDRRRRGGGPARGPRPHPGDAAGRRVWPPAAVGLCGGGGGRLESDRRTGPGNRHARRRPATRLLPPRRCASAARRTRRQWPHRRVGLPHGQPLEERVSARHFTGVEHRDLRHGGRRLERPWPGPGVGSRAVAHPERRGCSSASRDRAWPPAPGARPRTCRTPLRSRRFSTRSRS